MPNNTIGEALVTGKLFGAINVSVVQVYQSAIRKTQFGDKVIQPLLITDGTGTIKFDVWEPKLQFAPGDQLNLSGSYVKEYNGKFTLALTKNGQIKLLGKGPAPSLPPQAYPSYPPQMPQQQIPQQQQYASANQMIAQQPQQQIPQQNEQIQQVDEYIPDNEIIEKIIEVKEGLDHRIVQNMVNKKIQELSGLIDEHGALVIIATALGLEEEIKPKAPEPVVFDTSGNPMRSIPLIDMSQDELREAYAQSQVGAERGLIEKMLMHKQVMELEERKIMLEKEHIKALIIANQLKENELKLCAKIDSISKDYEETRKTATDLAQSIAKKSTKKSSKAKSVKKSTPAKEKIAPLNDDAINEQFNTFLQ